jgi:hypothetical protein
MAALTGLLWLVLGVHSALAQSQDEWTEVTTQHFRVQAVNDHAAQASWYAGFVEQVHDELSDLFAVSLDRTIRVRLYPTEEAYVAANPAAAGARGILAHTQPAGGEIGLALARIEALSGPSRVAAFRHELTHLLLDLRSGGRLPVAFQEGIAQYAEQNASTDDDTLAGLRRAYGTGSLLSLSDLNRPSVFARQPDIAYPESHALVAYLVSQHGVGSLGRLLDGLRNGQDLDSAMHTAFGLDSDVLERDWQGAVPGIVSSGLPRNVLGDGNLRAAQQAAAEQRWSEAASLARVVEQFWKDVGNAGHAAEAGSLAELADSVAIFRSAEDEAQQRLTDRSYQEAIDVASTGLGRLPAGADQAYRAHLQSIIDSASAGLAGQALLIDARESMSTYRILDAQRLAGEAAQQLTMAGDEASAAEARELLGRAQRLQQIAATTALVIAVLSGGAFWLSQARPASSTTIRPTKREVQL